MMGSKRTECRNQRSPVTPGYRALADLMKGRLQGLPACLPFVSRIAGECLEQLIEVGLSRLGKHALIAADSYCKLATRVRPPLLGYPLHLAQLRERARERVKHHRDCGT